VYITARFTCLFCCKFISWCLDGPYSVFAGRDASRGLAMFSVSEDVIREEYDDLSDLDNEQMERVREWEQQLSGESG